MSVHTSAEGPVQVVRQNDSEFELDEEALKTVLLNDEIKDKPVVVVSIGGGFRKGKSFLLNFLVRYLEAKDGTDDWLECEKEADLKGFHWEGGKERLTSGIWLWSRPFIRKIPDVGEVAILVMDTQGLYDRHTSVKDGASMFALSTMLSSMLLYNLQNNLQLNDFEHLQFFGEYAKMALDKALESKPFQRITLLVRDWQYPDDNAFGWEGGAKLLKNYFVDGLSDEMKTIWQSICRTFETVDCCLLPHPGKVVATSRGFSGRLQDIDECFVDNIRKFFPELLAPEKIMVKQIAGRQVTCSELVSLFQTYSTAFSKNELPEPKVMFACMAEAAHLTAMHAAEKFYAAELAKVANMLPLGGGQLEVVHENVKEDTVKFFNDYKKMGDKSHGLTFRKQLEGSMAIRYAALIEENRKGAADFVKRTYHEAKIHYQSCMSKILGDKPVKPDVLFDEHDRIREEALDIFDEAVDVGGDLELLEEFISDCFERFVAENKIRESKFEVEELREAASNAKISAACAIAEKALAINLVSDLEAQNKSTQAKMASLEAQLAQLSLQQQQQQQQTSGRMLHEDSGYGCSPAFSTSTPMYEVAAYSQLTTPDEMPPTPSSYRTLKVTRMPMNKNDFGGSSNASLRPLAAMTNEHRYADKHGEAASQAQTDGLLPPGPAPPGKCWVKTYTRKNGTVIQGHWRSRPGFA